MGAPGDDAYVDDLGSLVAALRTDPVNVQQVRGNGHTAEVDAQLSEIVSSSDVPVYVALVGELPGLAVDRPLEDLAVRLQSQLGRDAVYVLATGDHGTSWFYDGGDDALESALYAGLQPTYPDWDDEDAPRPSDAGQAAIIAAVVADDDHSVSADLVDTYTSSSTWTRQGYDSADDEPYLHLEVTAAAVLVGLFVALVGWRLTRTWALRAVTPAPAPTLPGSRRPASPLRAAVVADTGPDLEEVRRDATGTLDALAREVAERRAGAAGVDDALGCRVAAERVLGSDDLLDVVGALVLARTGRKLLDDPRRPYRPCFVNPLHGRGYIESAAAVGGGGEVTVPVCRRCSEAATSTKGLDPLLERRKGWLPRPARPYYEGDTVWARTGFGALDPELWRRVTEEP